MQQPKRKFDRNSPEVRAFLREVREATFTKEGMMVAFSPCFPGMTVPIVPDESHITALDSTPEGIIYGGTSGTRTHLFAAAFHGLTGIVFDLGTVEAATQCAAACCAQTHFVALVNGSKGGRAILVPISRISEDLIQEWGFRRPAFDDLGECSGGEPVVHAAAIPAGSVIGITAHRLFKIDPKSRKIETVGEVSTGGRIALTSKGNVVGRDGESSLWLYDPRASSLKREAVKLPGGSWKHPLCWAKNGLTGLLFTADEKGQLFSFDEDKGFVGPLGQTPLTPVGPMAVTFDGRLFGFCGSEMSKLFCLDPEARKVTNLGGAASIIERRRYGYVFGDAITGRDGEIVFGEDDNGGHLWLYFPRIVPKA